MKRAVVVACGLVLCVAFVVVGRWEKHRFERSEGAHMRVLWNLVSHERPAAYRLAAPLDCLDYSRHKDPFAVEVCFDSGGRLVDVIDRRGEGDSKRWSLRFDAGAAPVTVPPSRLIKTFHEVGALRGYRARTYLPTPQLDAGPKLAE
jgi:hypothetical protein